MAGNWLKGKGIQFRLKELEIETVKEVKRVAIFSSCHYFDKKEKTTNDRKKNRKKIG